MTRSGYLPIEAYGAIGNGRTVALVGSDGSIDWCCWPQFDSVPLFDRLLDATQGASFQIAPASPWRVSRRYLRKTNVLETTFTTDNGKLLVIDFMPIDGDAIVRHVHVLEGHCTVMAHLCTSREQTRAVLCEHDPNLLWLEVGRAKLAVTTPSGWRESISGIWQTCFDLVSGASVRLAIEPKRAMFADPLGSDQYADTVLFWRAWASRIRYDGDYSEAVVRSALVLKLLVHNPSGGIVAAPTTSLPEWPGGSKNWDYRYVWLRDSALLLDALMRLGLHDEAMRFWAWVEQRCISCGGDLRIMYRVGGSPELPERILEHLDGYRGSRPVRVGNAAATRRQLDAYGYLLDGALMCQLLMRQPHEHMKRWLAHLADEVVLKWQEPDSGIWEVRARSDHYTYSKLMCWVALDRALALARRGWLDGAVAEWERARATIRDCILETGFDTKRRTFTQTLRGKGLDASLLLIPILGFLPADDPRVLSTVDAIERELCRDGLVCRYTTDDGIADDEGAFVMSSFWLVEVLARAGAHRRARERFAHLIERGNDLGLYSEQIDAESGAFWATSRRRFHTSR